MSDKPSFELFPGFKVPPNDPSREVKRPAVTFAPEPPDYYPQDDDEDFDTDQWGEPMCDNCEGWGYTDCYCGGDLCVCRYNGEIPCPHCF